MLYLCLQRCLEEYIKEVKHISILSWTTEYDVRSNGSLSDASCKLFLEDLLHSVRKGLDRTRSASTSSGKSIPPPVSTSTPTRQGLERSKSIDDDMR